MQWAAVKTCLAEIKEPPHQNSVRLFPCKKIAAIHGHFPGAASSPPTTRKFAFSGWPQSTKLLFKNGFIPYPPNWEFILPRKFFYFSLSLADLASKDLIFLKTRETAGESEK